jgi:hypothetical protein
LGWYKLSRRLGASHVFASLKLLALRGSLATIGVHVSAGEYASLRERAAQMLMTPAQWLREAALSRRLPSPPVAAINREEYAELARLAANLNQLAHLANEGGRVTVTEGLLARVATETRRLRLALLGIGGKDDDR